MPDALTDAGSPHRELGLTDDEFDRICDILGRKPNHVELAMFSVMWSEHCSYKSSRPHLRRLPSKGDHVILGPGENAGVIDIGDGMAAVMRIESHNHPSFVEPYQGAATGVGGIIRDILTMGSRPLATFDSLRFGPPNGANSAKQRWLASGVVSGISGYGNSVGVPTLGGEIVYDPCYSGNPLVNVMSLGIMPITQLQRSAAFGVGNLALLIGASTGRDGIGGVSVLASAGFAEGDEVKRPSVQVGDPFEEKKLIEACLEIFEKGLSVGAQDLGGAGLVCATSETAAGAGNGMDVDLDAVPRREPDMDPAEVMTSESQERMLIVVEPVDVDEALAICAKWEIPASVVGRVTDTGRLRVYENGADLVADAPAKPLDEGIVYDRPIEKPADADSKRSRDPLAEIGDAAAEMGPDEIIELMRSPNLADNSWAWRQYDHQLFLNTVVGPGADACVMRVKNTTRALAISVDGIGRYGRLDPKRGAALAVAEACRNVATVGARPKAIVDCMNFGNPERPGVMWQFSEAVDGIRDACDALDVPVVGGNVSLYNETNGRDIDPTPVIGAVGLIDDLARRPAGLAFVAQGDLVYVLGATGDDLGGSEWLWWRHNLVIGEPPTLDYAAERALIEFMIGAQGAGLVSSLHDCSIGGIAAALVECALAGSIGCDVDPTAWAPDLPLVSALFAETASRAIASVQPEKADSLEQLASRSGVPFARVGTVGGAAVLGASLDRLSEAITSPLA